MDIRMNNATTVTRMWKDDAEGELVAAFQYRGDGLRFAQSSIDADMRIDPKRAVNVYYVVCHHLDGVVTIVRPKVEAEQKAA